MPLVSSYQFEQMAMESALMTVTSRPSSIATAIRCRLASSERMTDT